MLCDDDRLYTEMVEVMLNNLGHEVVGVARTLADSTALVATARPDGVILDLSLGFNSDFDVIETAATVGATSIVFSSLADDAILRKYTVQPMVVHKPDLTTLERVVGRLELLGERRVADQDRRRRAGRAASGPEPTTISDPQAFYGALHDASAGDVLVALRLSDPGGTGEDAAVTAVRIRAVIRSTDRILMSPKVIRVYLAGAEGDGVESFLARLEEAQAVPLGATLTSVVIMHGETPTDAFERLKAVGP